MGGYDGSGNYVRYYNWTSDAANSIPITASRFDTEHNGFAAGLSNCVTRDGQGKPTADISWQNHGITNLRDPTANQEPITLAFLNGTSGLNYMQGTQIKYVQTAAEIAAGVTPVNYYYQPGDVRRYGAVCDGVTNDYTAVQNALNVTGRITFPANSSVKVNTGLVVDASKTTLDGQGSTLISGLSSSGNLIKINNTVGPEASAKNALRNLYLSGSNVSGVVGLDFEASASLAGFTIDRVSINSFDTGTRIYTNAFCLNFVGCVWSSCANAVFTPGGGSNYGEKISFVSCFWFNNTARCLYSTYNACQYYVVNSSLDYSKTVCEVNQGRAYFDNCYLESNLDTAYWFITGTTESCYIRYRGGQIVITGAKTAFSIANADTNSVLEFEGVDLYSATDSVGGNYLGTGAGSTYARNCHITGFTHNALAWVGGSSAQNLCNNGAFPTDLSGWTLAHSGGSSDPTRDATGGPGGIPAMLFNASVAATDVSATWQVLAEPGQIIAVACDLKCENVAGKMRFFLQALGQNNAVIATSDFLDGINRLGFGTNVADTSFHTYRNTISRLPAGTTKVNIVFDSDYSGGYRWWLSNVVICKY